MKKNKSKKENFKKNELLEENVSSHLCIDARERYDYLNYLSDEIAEHSRNEVPNER